MIQQFEGEFIREEAVVLAHLWLLVWLVLSLMEVKPYLGPTYVSS